MSVTKRVAATSEEAARACAEDLALRIIQSIAGRKEAMVAVSGGSTPKLMFDALASMEVPWDKVHLFWVDERAVGPDHELSNYAMTKRHLIDRAALIEERVHRVRGELEPREAAARYAVEVRARLGELPVFDVVQCGIGADTHIASLFPGERMIGDRGGVAAAVYVETLGQWRITLLPGVLMRARVRLVLACGEDKADALRRVLRGPWAPDQYPAQLLTSEGLPTVFHLDQAAAAELG